MGNTTVGKLQDSTSSDLLAVSGTQNHTNTNERAELAAKKTKAPAVLSREIKHRNHSKSSS